MTELKEGSFCISTAGHDAGSIYIVYKADGNIVEVVDGKFKKLKSPKKKNLKHIELIEYKDDILKNKILANKLRDEDIKYSIKNYLIFVKRKAGGN